MEQQASPIVLRMHPATRPTATSLRSRMRTIRPSADQQLPQSFRERRQHRHAAALGALFFAGIQQHDDEDEQHHDRAGVHDHLHRRHKLRAQQQVFDRQRSITTISDSALLMGCFCTSRLTAPATQTAPKTMNRTR